jgi:hypothetical protein
LGQTNSHKKERILLQVIDEDDDIEVIKLDQEGCLSVCLELLAWIVDN